MRGTETTTMFYLSRWEKLEVDWDEIEKELSVMPFNHSIDRFPEHILINFKVTGDILSYPKLGGAVANNTLDVLDYINSFKRSNKVPTLPKSVLLSWGNHYISSYRCVFNVKAIIDVVEYCELNNKHYTIKETFEPIQLYPSIWCYLGFHKWEEILDFVRSTGFNVLFSSGGIQKAVFRCKCCGKQKKMWREGFVGAGVKTKWFKLNKKQEEYINSKRPL
jgi:hypothetical protein